MKESDEIREIDKIDARIGKFDPPFNSNPDYNVLFREPSGQVSQAQFHAFTDTWSWTDAADTYHKYSRIQILTVERLLNRTERIDAPPQINPFAMAARESPREKQTEML